MQQLRATTKSLTFPPLSIARYSFIQLSRQGRQWGEGKCPIFQTVAKGDSNPGSLDCESDILPLSYRAPPLILTECWFCVTKLQHLPTSGSTRNLHVLQPPFCSWLSPQRDNMEKKPPGMLSQTVLEFDQCESLLICLDFAGHICAWVGGQCSLRSLSVAGTPSPLMSYISISMYYQLTDCVYVLATVFAHVSLYTCRPYFLGMRALHTILAIKMPITNLLHVHPCYIITTSNDLRPRYK